MKSRPPLLLIHSLGLFMATAMMAEPAGKAVAK